jgi:hypothetical protein
MVTKKEFPQLMKMVVDKLLSKEMATSYMQYYIQKFGPLNQEDKLTSDFLKIFREELE